MTQFLFLVFLSGLLSPQLISATDPDASSSIRRLTRIKSDKYSFASEHDNAYKKLLELLEAKLERANFLNEELRPLFYLPVEGVTRLIDGNSSMWVDSYKEAISLPHIPNKDLKKVVEKYKEGVTVIGKLHHFIHLVYSTEPQVGDIPQLQEGLNRFKTMSFKRNDIIRNELRSIRAKYNEFVAGIIAKIDQSLIVKKQLLTEVNQLKSGLKSFDKKGAFKFNLDPVVQKQEELTAILESLLSLILEYNRNRVNWASLVIGDPLGVPKDLGVLGARRV